MIPDDRLEELLRRAEATTTADPAFLGELARQLDERRGRRNLRRFGAARWTTLVMGRAAAATLVALVCVVGIVVLNDLPSGQRGGGTGPVVTTPSGPTPSTPARSDAPSSAAPTGSATTATASPSAGCSLAFDTQPAPGGYTSLLATGFQPGATLTLVYSTANGESRTYVGGLAHDVRATADGSATIGVFGWTKPLDRRDRGRYVWRVTDGTCETTITADVGR